MIVMVVMVVMIVIITVTVTVNVYISNVCDVIYMNGAIVDIAVPVA